MEIRVYPNKEIAGSLKKPVWQLVKWLVKQLALPVTFIHVIFVNDQKMRELHKTFLKQNIETDVMTFNLNENGAIEAEIYISAPRAALQARDYDVPFLQEIYRLVIHGCLHLAGESDHTRTKRTQMKRKEDLLLASFNALTTPGI